MTIDTTELEQAAAAVKPWEGAPRTDAIWKRHTEDTAALENRGRELHHYYEMACHACELERELIRRWAYKEGKA